MSSLLYDIPITTADDKITTLKPFQGQVLLIVNVASKCGFTAQYQELESIYRQYKSRGFSVLAFPCNQFFGQEPGSNESIVTFATSCFQVTFPIFAKIAVKGANQAPLYQYLALHIEKKPWKFIPWNFTKILVSREGRVLQRFSPTTKFSTVTRAIEAQLEEKI